MTPETRTFDLGDHGTANAIITTPNRADLIYRVVAPHVRGSFTVRALTPLEIDPGHAVEVTFGRDGAPAAEHQQWTLTIDKPVVNRVTLTGTTHVYRYMLEQAQEPLSVWRIPVTRDRLRTVVTPATAHRASAVIRAIVTDYLARPDVPELHRAAAADTARARAVTLPGTIHRLESDISSCLRQLATAKRRLTVLRAIGTDDAALPRTPKQLLAGIKQH